MFQNVDAEGHGYFVKLAEGDLSKLTAGDICQVMFQSVMSLIAVIEILIGPAPPRT